MNAGELRRSTTPQTSISEKAFERYDDIPSPTNFKSGDVVVVVNDPDDSLNGFFLAAGAPVGQPAQTFIQK